MLEMQEQCYLKVEKQFFMSDVVSVEIRKKEGLEGEECFRSLGCVFEVLSFGYSGGCRIFSWKV